MRNDILEKYPEQTFLFADGFDDAIIGVCSKTSRLIYSVSKSIDILKKDMNEEDAIEHFYFNVEGSYVGEQTPIWCDDILLNKTYTSKHLFRISESLDEIEHSANNLMEENLISRRILKHITLIRKRLEKL